ncbi:MAG: 16S rRNA (adenine(1518)-N(6)/adenine(1519)-N(6))-dimethyltransferase RsmA [Clostridiales bacterium]|nr:MAG: 16S rRNA (adenine(1518)-N(6)/adenine(1519)-N(6))-dimethyltransferase RsmA [Clostridiales bacterium]
MRKIKDILIDNGFRFNHNLGQNFITDKNLLDKIVELSGVDENDVVVEIGTGAGTLTRAIAEKVKKVYSFEVDRALKPVLDETLSGLDNVEVIFKDVLKMKDKELIEIVGEKFKVVANIPYYITTALVMRFLEEDVHPSAITVMVQKEVADRFVAKPATEDYGAITMAISLYGDAKIVGQVDKSMFYPVPKVDSSIVRIDVYDKYAGVDKKKVNKTIKCAFMMRRKTLLNNLTAVYPVQKDEAAKILESLNIDLKARGETLTLDQIIEISDLLSK